MDLKSLRKSCKMAKLKLCHNDNSPNFMINVMMTLKP